MDFREFMLESMDTSIKEIEFAHAALMKIPLQYEAVIELNLLG